MKKAAGFLVAKRRILLCLFLVLTAASIPIAGQVKINYDLTEYLPADSPMKHGLRLMEQEFGPESSSQLRIMFSGLSEETKEEIYAWLSALDQSSQVSWDPGEGYNRHGYTLYEITTEYDSHSKEAADLFADVHREYDSRGAATRRGDTPFWRFAIVWSL